LELENNNQAKYENSKPVGAEHKASVCLANFVVAQVLHPA
jgi:hypothetical protein